MRKDDWITELYYKQISDKSRSNNNSRKDVSSKKKIPPKQNQFKQGECNRS
jgi:hypothetical protein|tara:strand:- start:5 stop:157 length:153 start_codon:yes stop_codon:yes gene_type:complete